MFHFRWWTEVIGKLLILILYIYMYIYMFRSIWCKVWLLSHWAIEISHGRNQKRNISIKYLNRYPKNIYGSRKSFNRKDCVNAFDKIWVKEIKSHYFQWQPEVTDDNFMPLVHSTNDISIIPENFKFSMETEDLNQTK